MRKPKVSERVWLRDDLKEGVEYGRVFYFYKMKKNEPVTVKSVSNAGWFLIDGDKSEYLYHKSMIDWEKTDKMNNGIVMPKFFDEWVKRQWSGSDLIIKLIDDARKGELCEGMQLMFYFDRDKLYCALLDGYVVEGEVE